MLKIVYLILIYKHSPLGILGTLAFLMEMPMRPVCARMPIAPRVKSKIEIP